MSLRQRANAAEQMGSHPPADTEMAAGADTAIDIDAAVDTNGTAEIDVTAADKPVDKGKTGSGKSKLQRLKDYKNQEWEVTKVFAKDVKSTAQEAAKKARDYKEGLGVDVDKVRKNAEFQQFLAATHEGSIDWTNSKEHARIKERFRRFERAKKVMESYQKLFDSKLSGLVDGQTGGQEVMRASILEMAEKDPDALRALEKQVKSVEYSQKLIDQRQKQIDGYSEQGGEKGLEDKLDTLTKANSWRRTLALYARKAGISKGQSYLLAYEKAKKEYGVEDSDKFKAEIKATRKQLNEVKGAASDQERIRTQYQKSRQEVLLDNDVARRVHQLVLDKAIGRMENIARDTSPKKISELKEARNSATAFRDLYERESSTGINEELAGDLAQFEQRIEARLQKVVEKRIERLISETPPDEIAKKVEVWLKKKDFAGASQRESADKVYKAFVKVKEKLDTKDEKYSPLTIGLATFKYLTA